MNWLKWFLWDIRICDHEKEGWYMREYGMGKIQYCKKCGKCVDLI